MSFLEEREYFAEIRGVIKGKIELLYTRLKMTIQEIAEELSLTDDYVTEVLQEKGLIEVDNTLTFLEKLNLSDSEEQREKRMIKCEIRTLHTLLKMPIVKIAKKMSLADEYIAEVLGGGMSFLEKREQAAFEKDFEQSIIKEKVRFLYKRLKMTIQEIAEELSLTDDYVTEVLQEKGLIS
ncbi:MAG: hypothetical protein FWG68_03630 [Defluviitaleaceae bacterium]|nr:hypothetical protein [Defluviitaleaceae bacterium]